MLRLMDEVCAETNNFFISHNYRGAFEIKNGIISPSDFIKNGQYFKISGSTFNDGIYQSSFGVISPDDVVRDEKFIGNVWAMNVPPAFIALLSDIKKWTETEEPQKNAYVSESFSEYSYTKATGANGAPLTWKDVFSERLKRYRKVRRI